MRAIAGMARSYRCPMEMVVRGSPNTGLSPDDQIAVAPPSTGNATPVVKPALSLHR